MKERLFSMRMVIYVSLTILLLSGITYIADACGIKVTIGALAEFSSFDLLLSQISNTFIVLSLTVVLSTNVGCVYWIDIKDHKLVEPMFSCFIAIMTYLLSNLGFSIVSYLLGQEHSLLLSFLLSIVLLMWLSYKMISVYFGRNRMKRKLMLEYVQNKWMVDLCEIGRDEEGRQNIGAIEAYRKDLCSIYSDKWIIKKFDNFVLKWSKIATAEKRKELEEISRKKLEDYEEGIRENSIRALNESNKDIIEENIQLIAPMDSSQAVLRLLSEIDVENPGLAADLLYQLQVEGNYNPEMEDVRIYATALLDRLMNGRCAAGSILSMAKLLGSLDGKEDYLEMLHRVSMSGDSEQMELDIQKNIIPRYSEGIYLNCYKLVDKIVHAYQYNKTDFEQYVNMLIWIKNKLEHEINSISIEIASKVSKFPLMMRSVHFLSEDERNLLERMIAEEDYAILSQVGFMNIYTFMDEYVIDNMDELIDAQSKYEKMRSIFGEKNTAVLRQRTKLAAAYIAAKDYVSALNLYEVNRNEIIDDEVELDWSNSIKAVALEHCGDWEEAWKIAYDLYKEYDAHPERICDSIKREETVKNAANVLFNHGYFEQALRLDEIVYEKYAQRDAAKAAIAYHRKIVTEYELERKEQKKYKNLGKKIPETRITDDVWKEAYERCQKELGREHLITGIAYSYYERYRTDVTEEQRVKSFRETYEQRCKLYGANHPGTISARMRLANKLIKQKDENVNEAILHYRGIYEVRKRVLGELHPETIGALFRCREGYLKQNNETMVKIVEDKLSQIEKNLDSVNQRLLLPHLRALIDGYTEMGKHEKVIELYQRFCQKQIQRYGVTSPMVSETMNKMAALYSDISDWEKVIECLETVYESAYKIRDLKEMSSAKYFEGLYRVKQQFPNEFVNDEIKWIRQFYNARIKDEQLSKTERLMEKVNFLAIMGREKDFYENIKAEWQAVYKELQESSGNHIKEMLLVLYSAKRAYERCKEMESTKKLQKEIDEILEALDNL